MLQDIIVILVFALLFGGIAFTGTQKAKNTNQSIDSDKYKK